MKIYRLKACSKCGGDLARDCGDWICLQCGAYAYVGLYSGTEPFNDSLPALAQESGRFRIDPKPGIQVEGADKSLAGSGALANSATSPYAAMGCVASFPAWQACRVAPW